MTRATDLKKFTTLGFSDAEVRLIEVIFNVCRGATDNYDLKADLDRLWKRIERASKRAKRR